MGLLRKKATATPSPAQPAAAVTIIAQGTELEGKLSLRGNVHVDGSFRGDILAAQHASVGTTGRFRGAITARHVLISGAFEGRLDCERLEITDTGTVVGEVVCDDLVIDGGGRFSGSRRARELPLALLGDSPTREAVEPIEATVFQPLTDTVAIPPLVGSERTFGRADKASA